MPEESGLNYSRRKGLKMRIKKLTKWVMLAVIVSGTAFAQPDFEIPDNAKKTQARVAMMGDIIVVETKDGLDEVWTACAQAPRLKPTGSHEYMAVQARNFTRREVEGRQVWLEYEGSPKKPRRTYRGRLIAYVYYVKEEGEKKEVKTYLLNAELIKRGLAKVDTNYPCGKRSAMYRLQLQARRNQRGIWSVSPR